MGLLAPCLVSMHLPLDFSQFPNRKKARTVFPKGHSKHCIPKLKLKKLMPYLSFL